MYSLCDDILRLEPFGSSSSSVVDSASVIISGFVVNSLDVDSYMDPELYCDLFTMAVHFHSYALFEGLR